MIRTEGALEVASAFELPPGIEDLSGEEVDRGSAPLLVVPRIA